nr:hypothetical protein [Borreliella andersonii]WNY69943.1 hypothetical protein QIA43_04260 [Borreliella andersonii]
MKDMKDKEYNLLKFKFSASMLEEILIRVGKLLKLKFGKNQRIHERIVVDKNSIRRLKIDFDKVFIDFNGLKYFSQRFIYGGALVVVSFDYRYSIGEENSIFSFEFMGREIFIEVESRSISIIQLPLMERVLCLAFPMRTKYH